MGAAIRILLSCLLVPAFAIAQTTEEGGEPDGLAALLRADVVGQFKRATEPRAFAFPDDHGPHPGFRNEWWYVTGNLDATSGRRFGFELTIFRFALSADVPASASDWATNQVYIAHFAVTDAEGKRFFTAERYSRGAAGLAGARADNFRVWIDDWEIAAAEGGSTWRLRAAEKNFSVDLLLEPLKAPVLNGVDGLSQKSDEPGNASYYYSVTRIRTGGTLRIGDDAFGVTGLSWLDREWSSSALGRDQEGWDWFALQLDDGSELMFYNLRKTDGSQDVYSAGTFTAADGRSRHLQREDVSIKVLDRWQSPAGGAYPSRWTIDVPSLELELGVEPVLADQELFTLVRYWEGAVDVSGKKAGARIGGRGYVELTGYGD